MFSMELCIDDESIGVVQVTIDGIGIVFRYKSKAIALSSSHILCFTRKGESLTIATNLSQQKAIYFQCYKIAAFEAFFLNLQTSFPSIQFENVPMTALERRLAKKARSETNAASFYGVESTMLAQLGQNISKQLQYRIEHSKDCQLDGIARPYQIFSLQAPAIEFLQACRAKHPSSMAKLYSYETNGSRKFLVADTSLFAEKYVATASDQRHVYEIIQDQPCRLYFDLEYTKQCNSGISDPNTLLDHFFGLLSLAFYRHYEILLKRDAIISLESSSDTKFSQHWIVAPIVDGKEIFFRNNIHAGHFVKSMLAAFVNDESHPFYVFKKDGTKQLFIDTGVYTKNRAFRLWLSSKYKSDRILASTCTVKFEDISTFLEKTYICPIKLNSPRLLEYSGSTTQFKHSNRIASGANHPLSAAYHYGPSPFPELDQLIRSQAIKGGVQGEIRSWQLQTNWITYHMDKNRFCGRINRPHKSNNIMFIIDRQLGVYYQKCHDPDCTGYRSVAIPLPAQLLHCMEGFTEGQDTGSVQDFTGSRTQSTQHSSLEKTFNPTA
ncbi:hypothetical protein THRCLA_11985 [Thraustotheca clavata]|uniref:DNA-directed primase/polymerase protein n=1 Tax=Thraustotheca clavata TaxID=74557 RepID=A0A1V9Y4E9_9STRA|nr:hypothetical protein THRCLA_11985 [Thraustotheca clavata]